MQNLPIKKRFFLNSYPYTYRFRKFVFRLPETEVVEILDVDEDDTFDAEAFTNWVIGWAIEVASKKANEIFSLHEEVTGDAACVDGRDY